MCGVFGFSGFNSPKQNLLAGLKRLEYRGYDSWGIAYLTEAEDLNSNLTIEKEVGALPAEVTTTFTKDNNAAKSEQRQIGIAHTRWATHGGVTKENTHPHLASDSGFALAQNGIVENYQELKKELLETGAKFISETDTEVIVRLIEAELGQGENDALFAATCRAFARLHGRNTIMLIADTGEIIAIKNGSPLVVGRKEDEYFLGSDYLSFANHANEIMELANFEGVRIDGAEVVKFQIDTSENEIKILETKFNRVDQEVEEIDMAGYSSFMEKEIYEQPDTILASTSYGEEELLPLITAIRQARQVYTVGCGTAAFAAGQIAYYLRKYAGIRAIELKGYELDSYRDIFDNEDLMIAISQSGETADTIEAVEFMLAKGGKVASIVNMVGSGLTKMSDFPYLSRTGPEICVASTKAYTAQIAWGLLLAQSLAGRYKEAKTELNTASTQLRKMLDSKTLLSQIAEVVDYQKDFDQAFVLGRGQNFYTTLEGALKIKEITYKHFEGFAAGELKHGVIALIDEGAPVYAIFSNDESKADMLSSCAEVKARGGKIIAVAPFSNELFDYHIEVPDLAHSSALANVLPFQLISLKLGLELGNNVDKPRNLAKSVTVK